MIVDQGGPGRPPVGGIVIPVSKLELLAPWVGLLSMVAVVAVAALIAARRRKP